MTSGGGRQDPASLCSEPASSTGWSAAAWPLVPAVPASAHSLLRCSCDLDLIHPSCGVAGSACVLTPPALGVTPRCLSTARIPRGGRSPGPGPTPSHSAFTQRRQGCGGHLHMAWLGCCRAGAWRHREAVPSPRPRPAVPSSSLRPPGAAPSGGCDPGLPWRPMSAVPWKSVGA